MTVRLLIAGASVRAYVQSALLAGYRIAALDLFADRDTCWMIDQSGVASSVAKLSSFDEIVSVVGQYGDCEAGIVCGGVENRVELVRSLEDRVKLLGPSSESLLKLRDSVAVYQFLQQRLAKSGVTIPQTIRSVDPRFDTEFWLSKNTGSSGGLGVAKLTGMRGAAKLESMQRCSDQRYFQERVIGESVSILYVSSSEISTSQSVNSATRIIGVTQQLVGETHLGAQPFQYCGSIGPFDIERPIGVTGLQLGPQRIDQIRSIGDCIAQEFGLVGVWGIDFIVNDLGAWPVDVNARLVASAELYESRIVANTEFKSIVDLHVKACLEGCEALRAKGLNVQKEREYVEGKAILFNRTSSDIRIAEQISDELMVEFDPGFFGGVRLGATVADVPCPDQSIAVGHPILTVRVRCRTAEEVEVQLREHAERIYGLV